MSYLPYNITICILLMVTITESFIMSIGKYQRKCFQTSLKLESTLQLRFGFPKMTYQNCKMLFTVDRYVLQEQSKQKIYTNVYSNSHFCHDRSARDLLVFKYSHEEASIFTQLYRICAENLDDFGTNKTYFQLIISQKQKIENKPQLVENKLIYSSQVLDLQSKVQSIKRKLSWAKNYIRQAEINGDKIDVIVKQYEQLSMQIFYIQIAFLICYGITWVYVAKMIMYKMTYNRR